MKIHHVSIHETHLKDGLVRYRAACTCLWQSPYQRLSEYSAEEDGEHHVERE